MLPDGPTEESTERDGILSYSKEWHALIIGLVTGLFVGLSGSYEIGAFVSAIALGVKVAPSKKLKQLRKEPWYALGGIGIGTVFGIFVRIGGFIT